MQPAGVRVAWADDVSSYDFGPSHPMQPVRLELTMRLARDLGIIDRPGVEVVDMVAADDHVLQRVHSAELIKAVRRAKPAFRHGLGTPDVPVFPNMHEPTARVVGGSVTGAEAVWAGEVQHAVNITGGLHHAMPDASSGFCVYNDVACAIAALLAAGAERVAYVDVDVHHGDGVERVFWDDPRVLTISLHESGRYLFPGTGDARDIGGRHAPGYAVNVALPPGTGDDQWLSAFDAVVPPLLEAFGPQVLVSQHGCDSHAIDPLAHLLLTVDAQREAAIRLHDLAHRHAGGRWLATGGGGYAVVEVVPRAWTHVLAVATGEPLPVGTEVPAAWRSYAENLLGRTAPTRMGDPAVPAEASDDAVAAAVAATRAAVFPFHGVDVPEAFDGP